MTTGLVDSHCHLDMIKHANPQELITTAQAQGVDYFLCVSVDLNNFPKMFNLIEPMNSVFASVGVHPNYTCDDEPSVATLVNLAQHPKVIAIGETGLDYYRSQGAWQHQRFQTHIHAAQQLNKPLIIHCREAREDTLRILQAENAQSVGGIMHCFVEDLATAEKMIAMGFYISFSGIVTFKQAKELQQVAKLIPLERLLVETDAPFLAPMPHRGQTNQPAYVKHVAEFIANLRGISLAELAQATTENFFRLFPQALSYHC